jgi:hypothetical protein
VGGAFMVLLVSPGLLVLMPEVVSPAFIGLLDFGPTREGCDIAAEFAEKQIGSSMKRSRLSNLRETKPV